MIRRRYARSMTAAAFSATDAVRVASNERISMRFFGSSPSRTWPLRRAPSPSVAVHSSSVPKSCTKPNSTSPMVGPDATATEREKKPMPRFALREPSIGSMTTCVRPSPSLPTSSEMKVTSSTSPKRASTARSAAWSIAVVSSPPIPAPTTGSRSERRGSSASTPRTSSTASRQSASQSVKRMEEQARGELRIEVRALLRHRLAAPGDRPHVLDPGRPQQERRLGVAAVDRRDRLLALRRVGDAFRMDLFDDVDIEVVAFEQLVAAAAVEDDAREVGAGLVDRRPARPVDVLRDAMRREDRQSLLARRDQRDHQIGRAALGRVRERRLVAVMPVGDQQLRLAEVRRLDEAPELVAAALHVGLAVRPGERVALVEEEDRLQLGARRPQEAQAAFLWPAVRALVRQDHAAV